MLRLIRFLQRYTLSINVGYLRKWLLVGCLVGIAAGAGSIVLSLAIAWATQLFLGQGAGFTPPLPVGEGLTVVGVIARRWMIPVVTTVGGLISGLIVYKLSPEAEGHGTDAAIEAFHQRDGTMRARVPLAKLLASAITIGSGGSAGPEGPAAQIGAGFGSLVGRAIKLSVRERRIALAAGIGAGIGSIFKAPLGGALLSAEILYLQGFEVDVLIPSFVASLVGYVVFTTWAGYTPIFGEHLNVTFNDPYSLVIYAGLGLACGLVGILYSRCFYALRRLFHSLAIPTYFKPALGGLAVGLIGLFLPQVLGVGYGWLQITMEPQLSIPLGKMVGLVFAKILATGLSVGSGGSGGTFAPALFIGGMLGGSFWLGLRDIIGHLPVTPEPFVVVGMMALLGGVARAPLAVTLMVAEMTGSYAMLAPAMIAVALSYVVVGTNTIYKSQVESPAMSPAHRYEYSLPLLSRLRVKDAMTTEVVSVAAEASVQEVQNLLQTRRLKLVPVLDHAANSSMVGIVTLEDILRVPPGTREETPVSSIMSTDVVVTNPEESLDTALQLMARHDVVSLPVIEKGSGSKLVGLVTQAGVARAYASAARKVIRQPKKESRN